MNKTFLALTFAAAMAASLQAAPMGTAFTYQGKLQDGGTPANGYYDFDFKLFDGANTINQQGATLHQTLISVSNGLFTVKLDFGNQFPGDARWLEIWANTNNQPVVQLSPRQELTPQPYALFAAQAGSATTAGSATSAGSVPWSGVGITLGPGIVSTPGGFGVAPGFGDDRFWRLLGNGGTDPAVNFLGTTDNVALTIRVNDKPAMKIFPDNVIRPNDLEGVSPPVEPMESPNIQGGFLGNFVHPNNKGVTLAGGGSRYDHVFHSPVDLSGRNVIDAFSDYSFLGSGSANNLKGPHNAIVAGHYNRIIDANYGFIGAGGENLITAPIDGGAIVAGVHNTVTGTVDTNFPSGDVAFIGAGHNNLATNFAAFIGAGGFNVAGGAYSVVAGGSNNIAANSSWSGGRNVIGGGQHNTMSDANYSAIGGGQDNTMSDADYSVIGGGIDNLITAPVDGGTIVGGSHNTVSGSGDVVFIGAGHDNLATNFAAFIGAGGFNVVGGAYSVVAGGTNNHALGRNSVVSGGQDNQATGISSAVGGGLHNFGSGQNSTISGGSNNFASGFVSIVAGGQNNAASGQSAVVSGGSGNAARGTATWVGGGQNNTIDNTCDSSSILGGNGNGLVNSFDSGVLGGLQNLVATKPGVFADYSTVVGGNQNTNYGNTSAILSGNLQLVQTNTSYAVVLGGRGALADKYGQIAFGSRFATNGDAQASFYHLRGTTTSGVTNELTLNGSGARLTIPRHGGWAFHVLVIGKTLNTVSATAFEISGFAANMDGTTVVTASTTVLGAFSAGGWQAIAVADDVNDALVIKVAAPIGGTTRWSAQVSTAEVNAPGTLF